MEESTRLPGDIHLPRRLTWEACYNVRDLGGLPAEDNRITTSGAFIRSDNPARLTEAGIEALVAYGVRTIVDLRSPSELRIDPSPLGPQAQRNHPVRYAHRPFHTDEEVAEQGLIGIPQMSDLYILMLQRFPNHVAEIMAEMAQAPPGGVLIHCHSGKDRTGIVSALLLSLVGVPADIIAQDYALSSGFLQPITDKWIESGPGERTHREADAARHVTRFETMDAVLRWLNREQGGAEKYLVRAGVDADVLDRLRSRLLGLPYPAPVDIAGP